MAGRGSPDRHRPLGLGPTPPPASRPHAEACGRGEGTRPPVAHDTWTVRTRRQRLTRPQLTRGSRPLPQDARQPRLGRSWRRANKAPLPHMPPPPRPHKRHRARASSCP